MNPNINENDYRISRIILARIEEIINYGIFDKQHIRDTTKFYLNSLSKEQMREIMPFTYKIKKTNNRCTLCLETKTEWKHNCGATYHPECILVEILEKGHCPRCRNVFGKLVKKL